MDELSECSLEALLAELRERDGVEVHSLDWGVTEEIDATGPVMVFVVRT